MGDAAVKVALGCGYVNAGTCEFLYQDGDFFFLEMNTRLQVEHPVTEMISGLDLVELQLRVASGEALPFTQGDVDLRGHAIEVRVNAENPSGGRFLPSPGRITKLTVGSGYGVRWDGGYEAGDEVSQYYDNLIGKLVVWGKDRDTAIARTLRALAETEVEGVYTTIPADVAILAHADFAALEHSTKWVEEVLDLSGLVASRGDEAPPAAGGEADAPPKVQREVDVEVNGKRFAVKVWLPEGLGAAARRPTAHRAAAPPAHGARPRPARPAAPPDQARSPCPCRARS